MSRDDHIKSWLKCSNLSCCYCLNAKNVLLCPEMTVQLSENEPKLFPGKKTTPCILARGPELSYRSCGQAECLLRHPPREVVAACSCLQMPTLGTDPQRTYSMSSVILGNYRFFGRCCFSIAQLAIGGDVKAIES